MSGSDVAASDFVEEPSAAGASGRRVFMLGASAAGMAALTARNGFAQAAAPRRGGHVRVATTGASISDTFDPGTFQAPFMEVVGFGLRNNLTEIAPDGRLVPELAESWEPSADAKTWTFKLRQGVEFHSGKTLSATDVIASVNHNRGPLSTSGARSIMAGIDQVRADGPNTVVFDLKAGNADFPTLLSDYHLTIMPALASGSADWQSGDGTGGYTMQSWQPGTRAVMKRFPNYWKPNAAFFEEAEVLSLPDDTSRISALITGQVDVADRINLSVVDQLKKLPQIAVESIAGRQYYDFEMDRSGVFKDPNLALAMKYAIDRKAMLDTVLRGYGSIGNDQPVSPVYKYFDATLTQHSYDPDKSKFYLKRAGLSQFSVNLNVSDAAFTGAVDSAELFQAQAAKANININVSRVPSDGYFSKIWGKVPFCASFWTGRSTEDLVFSLGFASKMPWNSVHWENARFNQLLVQARAELNEQKRREEYAEMQRLVAEDGGQIIPVFANFVSGRSRKVTHHPEVSSERQLDGAKLLERWWFA